MTRFVAMWRQVVQQGVPMPGALQCPYCLECVTATTKHCCMIVDRTLMVPPRSGTTVVPWDWLPLIDVGRALYELIAQGTVEMTDDGRVYLAADPPPPHDMRSSQ